MLTEIKIILLLSILNIITPIFLVLEPYEKRCVFKDIQESQILSGVYYISGEQEDMNEVTIVSPKNVILFKMENLKNASFSVATEINGQYSLCFQMNTSMRLIVSFDFHDETKEEAVSLNH
jgi:hypothetical protein